MKYLSKFISNTSKISIPERFTFPFYYTPHPLALIACKEVQAELERLESEIEHNFGLQNSTKKAIPIGKMCGVLVVEDKKKKLFYLKTFSGSLQGKLPEGFIPSLIDSPQINTLKKINEEMVEEINQSILKIEKSNQYKEKLKLLLSLQTQATQEIDLFQVEMREAKKRRKLKRPIATQLEVQSLNQESIFYKKSLRLKKEEFHKKIAEVELELKPYQDKIKELEDKRTMKIHAYQNTIKERLTFSNADQEKKKIDIIFKDIKYPMPSGSGECAAPKLLQFAYNNNLKPLALAEFWWGTPHKSSIRRHKNFYPACTSRCHPILSHMITGLNTDPNPMLINKAAKKSMDIVFEDKDLIIINKPSDLLSVPGVNIKDSVQTRMEKILYPYQGPIIIHRLDQSTSGIMILAKNEYSHKHIQAQFIKRSIKKSYIALLDGIVKEDEGLIEIPLKLDFHNRPRQMVCFKEGKIATTAYRTIVRYKEQERTLIHFFPRTGRTHQLRMHAAYFKGLDAPIIGDTLYGKASSRLHLHAKTIEFVHPVTLEKIKFEVEESFSPQ